MSGEGDLQVVDILLQDDTTYTNYGFDFKDVNGDIPVETFLNFQNKLQGKITEQIDKYKEQYKDPSNTQKPHITANQMFDLAEGVVKDNGFTFTLPIQITITYETNEKNGKITTNSYLEIIKDMFLNFITTTVTDPIYKQVFEVILPTDDVNENILQTVKSPGFNKWFHEKIMGADPNDISKSKKDYLNELIKQIGFIEKI